MRVLVTDGNNRAALAVTRSLGRAGHHVVVGEHRTPSLAQSSRYCARAVEYPDPTTMSDAFIDCLAGVTREEGIEALVPVSDIATFLVTQNRDRWPASCVVPFADAATVERAADKVGLVRIAERIGVAVPQSIVVEDAHRMPDITLAFPLVVKPWRSRIHTPHGWRSTAVSYAADLDALVKNLLSRPVAEFPVMLQERIIGPGTGVFAYYHRGRSVALFSHNRLRERPPWGGVSVLAESAPPDPVARDFATRLLDEIGWEGVAMVEFKRDLRDNVPKLMEINGRFWGSLQLAIDAGVDFPELLVRGIRQEAFEAQPPYRTGIRTRWLWGDVDSLLLTLFGGKRSPDRGAPPRLRALLAFMRFFGRDLHYDNPKLDDMRPFWYESRQWFLQGSRNGGGGKVDSEESHATVATRSVARPRLEAHVSSSLRDIGLDADGWDALAASSDTNTVFQTHEWVQSWIETFGHEQRLPQLIAVSTGGRTTAVAPLVADYRGRAEPVMQFLGSGRADYCDILGTEDRQTATTAILAAISDCPWSALELANVPAHSRTPDLVRNAADQMGYFTLIDEQYVCPKLLVRGHEAEADIIRRKASLRRRRRLFERAGRLEVRDLTTAEDIAPWLDAFFQQHISRWAATSSPSLFTDPPNQAFYRSLTARMGPKGWLLFSVIELDGQPIAFHYGFDFNDSVIWYKPSFNIAYAANSPGLVMVGHLIDYAIERHRRELDFTLGVEAFKLRFANSQARTVQISVFRDRARYMLERSKRQVSGALRTITR